MIRCKQKKYKWMMNEGEPEFCNIIIFSAKVGIDKRPVTIRREICPIRAEISTHKHGEKLYISYLYD